MKPTHLLAATLFTALIIACFAAPAAALEGSGTEADPYLISSLADLQSFRDSVNSGATTSGKYWQLTDDLDLSGVTWTPIGTDSISFSGTFDGNGHKISNIYISNGNRNNGLFSINYGLIKNLHVDTISITSSYTSSEEAIICLSAGGIAGQNAGTITNCIGNDLSVSGYNVLGSAGYYISLSIGSIAGQNSGTITNCIGYGESNIISNTPASWVGSIVGCNGLGISGGVISTARVEHTLSYDYSASISTTTGRLGGVVGYVHGGNIDNNVMLGNFLSSSNVCGRITGINSGGGNDNYALQTTRLNSQTVTSNDATSINGADITTAQAISQSFYQNTPDFDFSNIWYWDDTAEWQDATGTTYYGLPQLQVFHIITPTISSISATPATGGQLTEYTLSIIATTEAEGGITGYQWAYSTDNGQTWQAISGATTATYIWQPGTAFSGDVLIKCTVTGADGGTVDSYAAGYTNIKITIVPPPEIDSVSTSRPLQKVNTPTTLTATFGDIQTGNTYRWYYSTNGGTTWQAISGATQPTAQYTPSTTGLHNIKIVVTTQYGDTTETTTSITVLPTYTPTPITNTSVDISIDSAAKYQGMQQFTLSAELKALNYYTPTIAHLAHDNALYYLDSAALEVIPVSDTTGGTISAAYLGEYTGIITDTAGNTAFYSYQTNDWQYIEQNNAQIIASTASYAATVSGGTLRIYNLNGNLVASTATTAANLAGNDASNVFVSYSGSTLTYYWVNGNSISSATQTVTNAITELHQISGTSNFIISTAKNTVIAEISDTGVYSLVATSNTDTPLIHTQATSINIFIGVAAPNEIFIIGADGETDGTYQTGSTLSDASIAKSTGLFAIAGGADYQAYILSKSESSVWQLAQVVAFGEAIDYAQISTTGTYAAVSAGLKLYLLEAVDVSTGTYMLQGVIIGSSGNPYAGKLISINGDQIRTDTSGRFIYPVTPNTLYTIVADTTTTEYTATSAALQQIAIRLKPNPFAQSVSYSATYNEDTGNFEMLYEDSRDLTQQVTWTIRETGDNTIVHQVTVQPGQTATWQVPFDKVFQGYQISMDAERGSINVENVWMITPAGSQPINIPGLDDTGKNIIFGCVLMVIAGLFGVMFSTKGAIFVVLAAGVMTFLGLLTIPWEIIIVAGLLAFLAALAKGGGGQ